MKKIIDQISSIGLSVLLSKNSFVEIGLHSVLNSSISIVGNDDPNFKEIGTMDSGLAVTTLRSRFFAKF